MDTPTPIYSQSPISNDINNDNITECLIELFHMIDPSIILDVYVFHEKDFDKTVTALININSDINPDENDKLITSLIHSDDNDEYIEGDEDFYSDDDLPRF